MTPTPVLSSVDAQTLAPLMVNTTTMTLPIALTAPQVSLMTIQRGSEPNEWMAHQEGMRERRGRCLGNWWMAPMSPQLSEVEGGPESTLARMTLPGTRERLQEPHSHTRTRREALAILLNLIRFQTFQLRRR